MTTLSPLHLAQTAALLLALSAMHSPANAQIEIKPTHPNGEVSLVVDFELKAGSETEFETAFKRSTRCTRFEPGNITFNVHKVVGAENRYVLYEVFRSPAALQSHFDQPYTKALFAMFERTLAKPVTEGGLRFISDLAPALRTSAPASDPTTSPECR